MKFRTLHSGSMNIRAPKNKNICKNIALVMLNATFQPRKANHMGILYHVIN